MKNTMIGDFKISILDKHEQSQRQIVKDWVS